MLAAPEFVPTVGGFKAMKPLLVIAILAAGSWNASAAQPAAAVNLPARATQSSGAQNGVASWYGSGFIGGKTANGETYRSSDRTAAHKTLPFGTWVRVTERAGGRSTVVRINNRGPYVKGRVIDLSLAAAQEIGLTKRGIAPVTVEVLGNKPVERQATSINRRSFWDNPLFN